MPRPSTFSFIPYALKPGRSVSLGLLLGLSLLLGACASSSPVSDSTASAESLYRSAKRALDQGDFLTAIETFETLGARYPFGSYTQQAQLDVAYAYFRQDEFDNAISAADRFIKLYPRHERIDYAWYMKGLANFARGGSTMERLFPRDMASVNQAWLRSAWSDFDILVRRFPNSPYADDAIERMAFLRDEMARHELKTGRYYYERGAMVAAANRASYLLEHFDGSRHIPDALALLAASYGAMGQTTLREDTLRILTDTAPEHPALRSTN